MYIRPILNSKFAGGGGESFVNVCPDEPLCEESSPAEQNVMRMGYGVSAWAETKRNLHHKKRLFRFWFVFCKGLSHPKKVRHGCTHVSCDVGKGATILRFVGKINFTLFYVTLNRAKEIGMRYCCRFVRLFFAKKRKGVIWFQHGRNKDKMGWRTWEQVQRDQHSNLRPCLLVFEWFKADVAQDCSVGKMKWKQVHAIPSIQSKFTDTWLSTRQFTVLVLRGKWSLKRRAPLMRKRG